MYSTKYNLLIENLRGQGYDDASNMRGEWNGLQALFLKDSSHAYYIHCFAHRLQLALVAVSKEVHDVWRFFSTLTSAINFVDSSAKRHFQLKSIRKDEINDLIESGEIDTGTGANQDCSLIRAGATRWSSHFNSVRRFIGLFGSVSILLQDLVDKGLNSNIRGEAKGLYLDIKSFDFVFVLFLMHEVLGISEKLCQTLQKNDIDILNAVNLVSTARINLQQIRDGRWEEFLWSVIKFCESNDIEVPDFDDCCTRGTKRSCQLKNNITVHDHYHFEIFNAVIYFQLMELNERFPESTMELLTLSNALSPVDGFRSFSPCDICSLVDKFYYHDFSQEEREDLMRELDHYKFDVPHHVQFQNLDSLHHLCQTLARTTKSVIYALIDRLVRLVLTLPVSTATTERAFSGMKLIKTPFRNKMENDLLANTMVVYIERDIALREVHEELPSTKNGKSSKMSPNKPNGYSDSEMEILIDISFHSNRNGKKTRGNGLPEFEPPMMDDGSNAPVRSEIVIEEIIEEDERNKKKKLIFQLMKQQNHMISMMSQGHEGALGHFLSFASNISKKSDAYISSRKKAVHRTYNLDLEKP
ncbi:uncharacterized protein [Primulina eburnea]|uniref:uncharacterized protein n=1 Tax=Primulina eburnea TaxID=1245227 RepID=UPI003C6CC1B0